MGKAEFGIALDDPYGAVSAGSNLRGKVWADIKKEIQGTEFRGKFKAEGRMLCVVFEWSTVVHCLPMPANSLHHPNYVPLFATL
jgi:hypothetical protein